MSYLVFETLRVVENGSPKCKNTRVAVVQVNFGNDVITQKRQRRASAAGEGFVVGTAADVIEFHDLLEDSG